MNELLTSLAFWLADFFLLATALLAVAALAMAGFKAPPQRIAIAWATLAGLTALAAATAAPAWPRWDVRQWLARPAAGAPEGELIAKPTITYRHQDAVLPAELPLAELSSLPVAEPLPLPVTPRSTPRPALDWRQCAALAWCAAAAATLGWIALGAVQARRLLWTSRQAPPWIQTELARLIGRRKKPRLKVSGRIGSAVAIGALQPAILLPTDHVREENRAGVQAALAHEWAHIRRGDLWLLAWQRLLLPLLAVHPLFWLLRRQIRADQELLADLEAAGDKPAEYAQALLSWAKQAAPRGSTGLAALAMWEDPHTVSRRIQMILDPKNPVARQGSRLARWTIAAALATFVLGLSLVSLRSPPAAAQEDAAATENPLPIDSTGPLPPTAQIQQVELSISMIRLGNEGADITTESLRELGQPFGDNDSFAFDNGVCVVALPREQVATAIKILRESGKAKILAEPNLMTISGRDAYVADGGELPTLRETDFGDRRIEQVEFTSRRSLRVRPEIRAQSAARPTESKAASIVRLSVTREHIEPIDELDPDSETEKTRPKMITRQLTFTADVPIGRTLLVWELKHVAEDEANLVLITPEGIHAVTRPVLANPPPPAVDDAPLKVQGNSAWPQVHVFPNDKQAARQIRAALEKLRAEAATNDKLRERLQQETDRLQKQVLELTAQLRRLSSIAKADAKEKMPDADFVRRVYLDLLGVLPSADEVKSFMDSRGDDKRQKLIDKLLGDPKVADYWASTWRDLLVDQTPSDKAAPPTAVLPPTRAGQTRVLPLQHLPAVRAAEIIRELFQSGGKSPARVAADGRTNSLVVHGGQQELDTLEAILKVLDRPVESAKDRSQVPRAQPSTSAGHDLETQRRLLEIDLQQAEQEMQLAKTELDEAKKLGTAVSAAELRRKEAEFQQARLKRERAQVLLEAAMQQEKSAARSPLSAVDKAVVPPKNLPEHLWELLGLRLAAVDENVLAVNANFRGGLKVNEVRPGSPADDGEIRQGDILVGLGRWETRTLENLAYILARDDAGPGDQITFHVVREGKHLTGRLTMESGDERKQPDPATGVSPPSRRLATEIRLAEIDLREAQLKLEATSKKQARLEELSRQNTVPQSDLDQINLERQLALLAVEEAQIVLDGLKSQTAKPPSK